MGGWRWRAGQGGGGNRTAAGYLDEGLHVAVKQPNVKHRVRSGPPGAGLEFVRPGAQKAWLESESPTPWSHPLIMHCIRERMFNKTMPMQLQQWVLLGNKAPFVLRATELKRALIKQITAGDL